MSLVDEGVSTTLTPRTPIPQPCNRSDIRREAPSSCKEIRHLLRSVSGHQGGTELVAAKSWAQLEQSELPFKHLEVTQTPTTFNSWNGGRVSFSDIYFLFRGRRTQAECPSLVL